MDKHKTYEHLKSLGFKPNVIIDCGAGWGEWSGFIKSIYPGYILPNDMKQYLQFIDNVDNLKLYGSDCVPENISTKTLELLGFNNKLKRYHINKFYGNILRV